MTGPSMVRRWMATGLGGPDVLREFLVELPPPGPGQVTVAVRAAGVNPADYLAFAPGADDSVLPIPVGMEIAGTITAIGEASDLASGGGEVGDDVLGFQIRGGYSSALNVSAVDVFAKPKGLDFPAAANLMLVGTTAAEMLAAVGARGGETILLHGASGAVGVSVLQQARLVGVRVIGTSSPRRFETVRRFGGTPVAYGPGLADRVFDVAPDGVAAALDTAGTDEAIDVSLSLVPQRERIVTIAAPGRARAGGPTLLGRMNPASGPFRERARAELLRLAKKGELVVPVARTFPLSDAPAALSFLLGRHPGGKLALLP